MIKLDKITKVYVTEERKTEVLKGITVCMRQSEFVCILGHSGCGKTTLLNIIGGLDRYTSGDLSVDGKSTKDFTDEEWDTYRSRKVGFVFQSYNLIPHQTVIENVETALTISGVGREERRKRAIDALVKVGLSEHLRKKPSQLSGGEMQRVAIARAIVNDPETILADEPTGALDSKNSEIIMNLLKESHFYNVTPILLPQSVLFHPFLALVTDHLTMMLLFLFHLEGSLLAVRTVYLMKPLLLKPGKFRQ